MKRRIKFFIKRNKKLVFSILAVVVLIIFIVANKKDNVYASNDLTLDEQEELVENVLEKEEEKEEIEEIPKIKVDIKGEVKNPGVYELELGNRIIDVVNLSGGFTTKAITKEVNLSKKIYDEMAIIIPDSETTCVVEPKYTNLENDVDQISGLVNINTASKEDLMTLTGVGESKADAIIKYRKQNKFEKIEDIMNITGIKESLFNKIKDEITV